MPSTHGRANEQVRLSRRLAYVLRHDPSSVNVELDPAGWVAVDDLLTALAAHGRPVTRTDLEELVTAPGKQRFTFDDTRTRIRACQGHTVAVDLGLVPQTPPRVLFHGTTEEAAAAIMREGLRRGARHHVHLSADVSTARQVGSRRRGAVVVLEVAGAAMASAGHLFWRADNGVWLTDAVAPQYLRVRTGADG